jgi:hypothetical protein
VGRYPALVDEGKNVAIRLPETERDQAAAMWTGTRRLLLLTMPSVIDVVQRQLSHRVWCLTDDLVSSACIEAVGRRSTRL